MGTVRTNGGRRVKPVADQLWETAHLLHAMKAHLLLLGVQITSSRRRNGNTVTRLDATTTRPRNRASLVILELGIRLSLASSLLLLQTLALGLLLLGLLPLDLRQLGRNASFLSVGARRRLGGGLLLHRSNLATTIALASDILHHTGISRSRGKGLAFTVEGTLDAKGIRLPLLSATTPGRRSIVRCTAGVALASRGSRRDRAS